MGIYEKQGKWENVRPAHTSAQTHLHIHQHINIQYRTHGSKFFQGPRPALLTVQKSEDREVEGNDNPTPQLGDTNRRSHRPPRQVLFGEGVSGGGVL